MDLQQQITDNYYILKIAACSFHYKYAASFSNAELASWGYERLVKAITSYWYPIIPYEKKWTSYAVTMVRYGIVDHIRIYNYSRHIHKATIVPLEYDEEIPENRLPEQTPFEDIEAFERRICQLAPRHKEICRLRFIKGLSMRKIGEKLGVSQSAISLAFKQIRATMRNIIKKELKQNKYK
jgi:RNA polymerase sigma factor (sigma-70 family)